MTVKHLMIIFAVLGITATFMPWLHYPKGDAVFYGYIGDGLVTGLVFFIWLVYLLFTIKQNTVAKIPNILIGLSGFFLAFIAYSKIINIKIEKLEFSTENPLIALATAGFHEGTGVYILGIAGLGLGISALFSFTSPFIFKKLNGNIEKSFSSKSPVWVTILLFVACVGCYFLLKNTENIADDEIKVAITTSVASMSHAFEKGKYEDFVSFMHPTMIQSFGGRQKTLELLNATNQSFINQDTKIKDVRLGDVLDIQQMDGSIQAVISQIVTYDVSGEEKNEMQKLIAISEDRGKSWKYINIGSKSKDEIFRLFPFINPKLAF